MLLGAATSMGAVAIWSMHYIGNRAIIIYSKIPLAGESQIQYSPGFTAGSFFLAISGITLAFYFLGSSNKVSIVGTVTGGFLVGMVICGMHYMGQGGIANYKPSYLWPYVFGAALIAIAASIVALGVFFYFRSIWTNKWQKRLSCALLLAGGVSGMHWVATVGTKYHQRGRRTDSDNNALSRTAVVLVVLVLSLVCCFALFVLMLIGQRTRHRSANRAQEVVLACAIFDADGRLMVTPEALLPCRKITNSYIDRSFDDVFDVNHPVFCWLFRASRCWPAVVDLIPGMRNHLRTVQSSETQTRGTRSESIHCNTDSEDDYTTIFKELFCVAAKDLADSIQGPLHNLGLLFDEIMSTGTRRQRKSRSWSSNAMTVDKLDNASAERGLTPLTFGRGQVSSFLALYYLCSSDKHRQVLFLVRRVSRNESLHLQSAGYSFANVVNVVDSLARSMEVARDQILQRLIKMQDYREHTFEPGINLGCFALRPLYQRGFDVLVNRNQRNMLPAVPLLPTAQLSDSQREFLAGMDDWSLGKISEKLLIGPFADSDKEFARLLLESVANLVHLIDRPFIDDARLIAKPFQVPCRLYSNEPGEAFLLAFRIITSVHEHSGLNPKFEFTPRRFFLCQQHTYQDSPDIRIFARKIHHDFAAISGLSKNEENTRIRNSYHSVYNTSRSSRLRPSSTPIPPKKWPARSRSRDGALKDDHSAEKNLVESFGQSEHLSSEVVSPIFIVNTFISVQKVEA